MTFRDSVIPHIVEKVEDPFWCVVSGVGVGGVGWLCNHFVHMVRWFLTPPRTSGVRCFRRVPENTASPPDRHFRPVFKLHSLLLQLFAECSCHPLSSTMVVVNGVDPVSGTLNGVDFVSVVVDVVGRAKFSGAVV